MTMPMRSRSFRWRHITLCGVLSSLLQVCQGALTTGSTTVPANGTDFLAKFCFDFSSDPNQSAGLFNLTLWSSEEHSDSRQVMVALFDDQAESYPEDGVWNTLSCDEKLKHARWTRQIPGSAATKDGYRIIVPMTEHLRPRWWYVAIADCSGNPFDVRYSLHMVNPLLNWEQEFSMDHHGIVMICIFLLLMYCVIASAQFQANKINADTGNYFRVVHPLVRILTVGIMCSAAGMLAYCIHYGFFAMNGQGFLFFYLVGQLCQALSKFLLMSILLLISQGRCISYSLSKEDLMQLVQLLGPFFCVCLVLELWGHFAESRNFTTGFVYASHWGTILIIVDLFWLAVYFKSLHIVHTAELDTGKQSFYRVYGTLYGGWFLVLPLATLISCFIAPWVRFKVTTIIVNVAQALMFGSLVAGLWPNRTETHFSLEAMELETLDPDNDWGIGDECYKALY